MSKLTTILHVDDDADMRAVVQVALRDLGGFDVRQARDGAEAVEMADESRPDLIILDMMMPRMDGRETLAAIHRLPGLKDLPAIFLTAKTGRDVQAAAASPGVLGVILKPFSVTALGDQVRRKWNVCAAG
ncbi:response regulator [Tranquillimonas alkanivorans]|uniref:Response regulator receiver domain-containing protein n=1 Tax=Tranquillimonas alkanivorans TaxID=441119 RepID=A0A1I5RZB6_9RHOB|nr:response regulator [Tranquillimonas alkanivorans]SFP63823.1 Response regulator receiver domain-containing protein [Tranquillimonas alkanivorans]